MKIDFSQSVKCNLHAHTDRSDGEFNLQALCELYRKENYKYLAITDHRVYYDKAHLYKNLQVLSGCEFNCYLDLDKSYQFHLLALKDKQNDNGIRHNESPYNKQFFTSLEEVQHLINELKARGNLVFIAHPKNPLIPLSILRQLTFDGFEIYNTKALSDASSYFDELYKLNPEVLMIATDDSHKLYYDNKKAFFKSYIAIMDNDFYKNLKQKAYYASTGIDIVNLKINGDCLEVEVDKICTIRIIVYKATGDFYSSIFDGMKFLNFNFEKNDHSVRIEMVRGEKKAWTNFYRIRD